MVNFFSLQSPSIKKMLANFEFVQLKKITINELCHFYRWDGKAEPMTNSKSEIISLPESYLHSKQK
jgi:hypothetical protein